MMLMTSSYLSIFILFLLLAGCVPPEGAGRQLYIQLQMPDEYEQFSSENTEVKLINMDNGTTYIAKANDRGIASFQAEYGIYRVTAQLKHHTEDAEYLFNGGQENIYLTSSRNTFPDSLIIQLTSSKLSFIIIKEIYYSCCYDNTGKEYMKDNYISLYNNSDETVWLDSLCIGTVAPLVANTISPWLTYCPDSLAISFIGWQFPGSGNDYPLLPGETTTIAVNAVNHTGDQYNHPNSIDLSKANWAFYHPSLTQEDIDFSKGVVPLNMFKRIGSLKSYTFTISGSGFVLYRIPNISAEEYAANPKNIRREPPQYTKLEYLMIPTDWALDCVDCVENTTKQGFKRFPSWLDAEPTWQPSGKYSARSLHRKVSGTKNGRIIYQDTNNSANDFEERIPAMKS